MSLTRTALRTTIRQMLDRQPIVDIHTHLFDPALGSLLLWGIDELLTYHYLAAEVLRARPDISPAAFWKLPKPRQADLVWDELFLKRTPVSEACRGVVTVLNRLGFGREMRDLRKPRKYFSHMKAERYVDKVFDLAHVRSVYMTNDPLDPQEAPAWKKGFTRDPRFHAALRLDSALMSWPRGAAGLRRLGYDVDGSLSAKTVNGIRHYLNDWADRLEARYMAISLPPSFAYPDESSPLTTLFTNAALHVARERGLPVAMMIGVKKLVNPALLLAGDSVGKSDIDTVERLARDFSDVRFLVTMLARENMHELCVAARKFANILPFGCWWFLNNPSLIREITDMRLELLGLSFIPQHSDARVLDQLIYKWDHSRRILGDALAAAYEATAAAGWRPTREDIRRDLNRLLGGGLLTDPAA
jgi:hypothetical protein